MKLYADDVYEAKNRYWHADLHLRVTKDDKDPEELEHAEERVQRAREFCEIVLGRAYTNRLFESLIGYHTVRVYIVFDDKRSDLITREALI